MATLYDNYSGTAEPYFALTMNAANDWGGQTFTAAVSFILSRIDIYCAKGVGDNVGTITVALYAVDGSGHPTGSVLASGSIADASIGDTSSYGWVACTLSSTYSVSGGTKYAIVVHGASLDASNVLIWSFDDDGSGSSDFSGGDQEWSTDGGTSWATDSTQDQLFRCYGDISPPTDKTYSKKLISIGNHEVWYESSAGTMAELSAANGDIDTSQPLEAFEAYEKIFITNGTNKKVADFGNTKITTADIKPAGKVIPIFADVLTGGTSGAKMVVDYIDASDGACNVYGKRTTTATFVDTEVVTGSNANGDVSFTLNANETAPPHWYDWTVYSADATTYGTIPDQVNAGCLWSGRGVICVDKYYPHQWYMTRQGGNMWDFAYLSNDLQSPVAGGGDPSVPGQVGDILVVPIPYDRDHLLFGCANSIYCMFGNPAGGGSLDKLDIPGGILGTRAWCIDRNGNLYMLTSTGLIKIPKGFGTFENLTERIYPDFITDLAFDSSTHRIVMGYDKINHGIKIVKVTLSSGANTGWWYDLKAEGLFSESYGDNEHGIFSMFNYEATSSTYRKLLLGCNNGYIYYENSSNADDTLADDSAQAIDSYATFGPIKLGQENREGKINNLIGILAGGGSSGSETDSNDVAFKVWTELSADRISERFSANSGQKLSGTIKAPGRWRGNQWRRSIRGMFAGIRLGNSTAGEMWGLERLLLEIKKGGKLK